MMSLAQIEKTLMKVNCKNNYDTSTVFLWFAEENVLIYID